MDIGTIIVGWAIFFLLGAYLIIPQKADKIVAKPRRFKRTDWWIEQRDMKQIESFVGDPELVEDIFGKENFIDGAYQLMYQDTHNPHSNFIPIRIKSAILSTNWVVYSTNEDLAEAIIDEEVYGATYEPI